MTSILRVEKSVDYTSFFENEETLIYIPYAGVPEWKGFPIPKFGNTDIFMLVPSLVPLLATEEGDNPEFI